MKVRPELNETRELWLRETLSCVRALTVRVVARIETRFLLALPFNCDLRR